LEIYGIDENVNWLAIVTNLSVTCHPPTKTCSNERQAGGRRRWARLEQSRNKNSMFPMSSIMSTYSVEISEFTECSTLDISTANDLGDYYWVIASFPLSPDGFGFEKEIQPSQVQTAEE
jgi:hypothetical protein